MKGKIKYIHMGALVRKKKEDKNNLVGTIFGMDGLSPTPDNKIILISKLGKISLDELKREYEFSIDDGETWGKFI